MSERAWRWADSLAHFLYEPALMGSRCKAVPPWKEPLHRIHLIPVAWLDRVCHAYYRASDHG